jgi:hypothetical protein
MVDPVVVRLGPEVHPLYPPPKEFEHIWTGGGLHAHQYLALATKEKVGRIHAPTATGKSRAASFFAVSQYHLGNSNVVQSTFAYPTNLLTSQQYERGIIEGLIDGLGYRNLRQDKWQPSTLENTSIPYQRLDMPEGGELKVAKLTGADLAKMLETSRAYTGKADLLEDFLGWLNESHNFLVVSPDLVAYAAHEQYGSSSFYYHSSVKRRVHNLLRGRTLILDEYHQYDFFTLINLERLVNDDALKPDRVMLLSATKRGEFFPSVPEGFPGISLPEPSGFRTASREIVVRFHFSELPEPEEPSQGLALYVHNSVVQNRSRCARLRSQGVKVVQWDGTRKDEPPTALGQEIHLVLGTSAIEVGLDLDADALRTEWSPHWMTPDQVTQRIGRIGRREGTDPAIAEVYVPGATDDLRHCLESLHGRRMNKTDLHEYLHSAVEKAPLRRENYVSNYYLGGEDVLVGQSLLDPGETLRYSFRPPGSQGLFLDRTETPPFLFLYEKVPIINRYNVRPPTPEDFTFVSNGWQRLCEGLNISLDSEFLIVVGERRQRDWLQTPSGRIEDLRKPKLRRFYVERRRREDASSMFI